MYSAADLLRAKGSVVHSIHPSASVLDAAQRMNDHRIGSLVVLEGGRLAGIITERDILVRVVAAERSPGSTRVEHVMTRDVKACTRDASLAELRELMRESRIRHVPVVSHGEVVGLVSIGDVNAADAKVMAQTISYLEGYICG